MNTASNHTVIEQATRMRQPAWLHDGRFEEALGTIASNAVAHDRDGSFPFAEIALLEEIGVSRLTAPITHGGFGADLGLARSVLQRIGAADPSVGLVMLWQFLFLAELNLCDHGWSECARSAVLDSLKSGKSLINGLNVEPDLGSPSRGGLPATRAVRQQDGSWRLSGHKIYATGIPALRWLVVSATIDDGGSLRAGRFLADTNNGQFRVQQTWDHIGLRASASHDVIFEETCVSRDFLISENPPMTGSMLQAWKAVWTGTLIASLYNGIAHASRKWLVNYLNSRVPSNLGASLATLPRFQMAVGQIELWLATNDRLLASTAAHADYGTVEEKQHASDFSPLLKHLVTDNVIAVTSSAVELTGNPGHSRHNAAERYFRDALTGRVHTPQSDVALMNAGKAALANSVRVN
jgi:alkylation response protein AidB-like acyl-CoA dehydrogenase